MTGYPTRERSCKGSPRPASQFERGCAKCGASFWELTPGTTGERGIWNEWDWYCSTECARRARVKVPS